MTSLIVKFNLFTENESLYFCSEISIMVVFRFKKKQKKKQHTVGLNCMEALIRMVKKKKEKKTWWGGKKKTYLIILTY